MTLRFGTDGVRGPANTQLSAEYALSFGRAMARVLNPERVVVGRDTRESGPMLEAALCAGLCAEGVAVTVLGVCPTPAVAYASAGGNQPGVMISASHNPYGDNGLKVFAAGGFKLTDAQEQDFVTALAVLTDPDSGAALPAVDGGSPQTVNGCGSIGEDPDTIERYVAHLLGSIAGRRLDGAELVIDCAHGSAWQLAPRVLRSLGARVQVLGADPDGRNINAGCGSTHLEPLRDAVLSRGAPLGLAFDGDADRVLAVDHLGRVIDGDQLIAICALDRHRRGQLRGATVAVTVMTNLGFRQGMARHGIAVVETAVGDRSVLEAIERDALVLGGEQSGHIIFRDLATTGDGLLSALQVLDLCHRSGALLADLADEAMTRLPQVLRNVPLGAGAPPAASTVGAAGTGTATTVSDALAVAVEAVGRRLGDAGRVLVRASGTEPLLRIMVEAPTQEQAEQAVQELAAAASITSVGA
ncbi:MAG: phosphoglucosamine mutase [Acidimicrobiales bacterium]